MAYTRREINKRLSAADLNMKVKSMNRICLSRLVLALVAIAGTAVAETTYQNPITAAPPLARPSTSSCTVTLTSDYAFNNYYNPAQGTFTPPASCPGPWAMVVLDWNASVAGRQFDRFGGVWLGTAELLRTTTPEPTPTGISWHIEKDVTAYSALFSQPQSFLVNIPNIVNSTYTGIIYLTVTLTFYQPSTQFPAANQADVVMPISRADNSYGDWFELDSPSNSASASLTLPQNTERAYLDVYASAHICDEFWYANAPTSFIGTCGGDTAFREIQISIDGQTAGVAWPFPYIYTGGINPFLWRPIPAVNTFNIRPYRIDLSPYLGNLMDGNPHTIRIQVYNLEYFWLIDANLLVFEDHGSAVLSGAVTNYQISGSPSETVKQNVTQNGATFNTTTTRALSVSGYVDTSAGRITTTVQQNFSFTNSQAWDLVNFRENVKSAEIINSSNTVTDANGTTVRNVVESYPVTLASAFVIPNHYSASFFVLPATVSQNLERTTNVSSNGTTTFWDSLNDGVQSSALLIEGTQLVKNGTDSEDYIYSNSNDVCFNHNLQATQGFVTSDTLIPACPALTLP